MSKKKYKSDLEFYQKFKNVFCSWELTSKVLSKAVYEEVVLGQGLNHRKRWEERIFNGRIFKTVSILGIKENLRFIYYYFQSRKRTDQIISIKQIPELEERLERYFHASGNRVNTKSSLYLILYFKLLIKRNIFNSDVFAIVSRKGVLELGGKKNLLNYFEEKLIEMKNKIKRELSQRNIRFFFAHDFNSFEGRLILESAKELGIKCILVNHGVSAGLPTPLITCIDRLDFFIVYTNEEEKFLSSCISNRNKIVSFGFNSESFLHSSSSSRRVLVIPPSLLGRKNSEANKIIQVFSEVINSLIAQEYIPIVRFHPRDSASFQYPNGKYESSVNLLKEDFSSCVAVIGAFSTVLFESTCFGIPTFQVCEFEEIKMPIVDIISVKEISLLNKLIRNSKPKKLNFDNKKFDEFMKNLTTFQE